jgi:hypothetical protein
MARLPPCSPLVTTDRPTHHIGRVTPAAGGCCFLVGTGLVAGAVHIAMLVIGRIVLGFGVGE